MFEQCSRRSSLLLKIWVRDSLRPVDEIEGCFRLIRLMKEFRFWASSQFLISFGKLLEFALDLKSK